jgi:hypothetical protein
MTRTGTGNGRSFLLNLTHLHSDAVVNERWDLWSGAPEADEGIRPARAPVHNRGDRG